MEAPFWNPINLANHYATRLKKDKNCLQVYPNGDNIPITEEEYRDLSEQSVLESWAAVHFYKTYKNEFRKYFADDELDVSVVSADGRRFITCFHFHKKYVCKWIMKVTTDDRKEVFRNWVRRQEEIEQIMNVDWDRGAR